MIIMAIKVGSKDRSSKVGRTKVGQTKKSQTYNYRAKALGSSTYTSGSTPTNTWRSKS